VAKNMSEKPYKTLGIDLVDQVRRGLDGAVDGCIRTSRRIRKAKKTDNDVGNVARARAQDKALRKLLDGRRAPISDAMASQDLALAAAQEALHNAEMRKRLAVQFNPKRQQPRVQEHRRTGPAPF